MSTRLQLSLSPSPALAIPHPERLVVEAELMSNMTRDLALLLGFWLSCLVYMYQLIADASLPENANIFLVYSGLVIGHLVWLLSRIRRVEPSGNRLPTSQVSRYVRQVEINSALVGSIWLYATVFFRDADSAVWRGYLLAACIHMGVAAITLGLIGRSFIIQAVLVICPIIVFCGMSHRSMNSHYGAVMMAIFTVILWIRVRDLKSRTAAIIEAREGAFQLNRLLEAAKEEAETAVRTRDQCITNISHELRNPIQGISGTIAILKDTGNYHGDLKAAVDGARESCRNVSDLITQLLDMADIQAGRRINRPEVISVKMIAKEVAETFQADAASKGVRISVIADPSLHTWIRIDPFLLRKSLMNLVSNAVKYTEAGQIDVRLSSELDMTLDKEDCHAVRIEVIDSGGGIPKAKLDALFEPHVRGENAHHMGVPGTGLGLAIVKSNADLMGGTVSVHSDPDCGTRVSMLIPAPRESEGISKRRWNRRSTPKVSGRALVVEDNETNRIIASKHLQSLGMTCEVAATGEEAVEHCTNSEFDIILMDYNLAGTDGREATKIIRTMERERGGRRQLIVAVTAATATTDRDFQLYQMDDFLGKPYEKEDLAALMVRHLGSTMPDQDLVPDSTFGVSRRA